MSSKFAMRGKHFRTPPVCKKTPPPPLTPAGPPTNLGAMLNWNGFNSSGTPVNLHETIPLRYIGGFFDEWQGLLTTPVAFIEYSLFDFSPFAPWDVQIFVTIAGDPSDFLNDHDWDPRTLDPYDSGLRQLTIFGGTGQADTRIML